MINDDYINNKFWGKQEKRINKYIVNKLSDEELNYLHNRYSDSESLTETIYRIKYNIEIRPKCPVCGKPVKYIGKPKSRGLFSSHCSVTCSSLDTNVINIRKQTCLKKYNNSNYNNIEKTKQTCLSKYGVETVFNIPNIRSNNILSTHSYVASTKRKLTCIEKYGFNTNLTYLQKNNLIDYTQNKIKEYHTKKQNHSFNTSKQEDEYYIKLKEKYPDVIRQYRDNRYPFNCDFYVPSKDLFIEYNCHWTHGNKPFEGTLGDLLQLQEWVEKNTEYYDNAITTWCIRDVKKRNIAKQNKLNYIEIWEQKKVG